MATTLQELVTTAALNLSVEVKGSPESFDEPISWVHSTELVDPTAYLDGGELILTTGLQLSAFESPTDRERHYVERLSRVGVRGIGFGTGLHHMSIPHWLVEQCESWEMPLLGVPLDTPFIAIAKSISRGQSDSHNVTVTRLYNAQRQLFRSIQTLDPLSSIVKKLAELIGGWAAFVNPSGKVMETSHAALPLELRGVDDAMGFTALGQAKFLYSKGYDIAIFHVATAQRQSLGYLVAGRFGEKGSLNHPLVSQTAALLSLAVSRNATAERSLERLRATMMRRLLEGDVASVREYAGDLWDGLPPEPLTVLRITGEQDALEVAQAIFEPMHRSLGKNLNTAVSGMVEGDLWAIVSRSNLADWVDQVSHDARLVTGISSGFVWWDAPRARHEAYQAAAEAVASGEPVMRFGQRAGAATLEALIEPSMLRAFGDLRLAPIRSLAFNVSIGPHARAAAGVGRAGGTAGAGGATVGAAGTVGVAGVSAAEPPASPASPGSSTATSATASASSSPSVTASSAPAARVVPAIAVLRAWLKAGCKYEEAAEQLGLHRHTVRKYISQICERLSVDPTNPEHIAELWYACRGSQFDRA